MKRDAPGRVFQSEKVPPLMALQAFFGRKVCHVCVNNFFLLIFPISDGIPSGWSSSPIGRGAFSTPGMGISRAREKVAQFGAKCLSVLKLRSLSKSVLCLKIHLPRRISQGSRTLPLGDAFSERTSFLGCETSAASTQALITCGAASKGDWPNP